MVNDMIKTKRIDKEKFNKKVEDGYILMIDNLKTCNCGDFIESDQIECIHCQEDELE